MGCATFKLAHESLHITSYTSKTIKHGPGLIFKNPLAKTKIITDIKLTAMEYLVITHIFDDDEMKINNNDFIEHFPGPGIYKQQNPYATVEGPYLKHELSSIQYSIVTNSVSGEKRVLKGPCIYMPLPYEKISNIYEKTSLFKNEYIKIIDYQTGNSRVVTGPCIYQHMKKLF